MTTKTDKQRIVKLQAALKVAREALEQANYSGSTKGIEDALDKINALDWNSKPSGIQRICGHGENVK